MVLTVSETQGTCLTSSLITLTTLLFTLSSHSIVLEGDVSLTTLLYTKSKHFIALEGDVSNRKCHLSGLFFPLKEPRFEDDQPLLLPLVKFDLLPKFRHTSISCDRFISCVDLGLIPSLQHDQSAW